jgi:hypothetical protein
MALFSMMFALYLAIPGGVSAAGNPNPGVLSPESHAYGMTYAEWATRWWQWAYALPVPGNPFLDTTGAYCAAGQSGQVWFLAGAWLGSATPIVRSCAVPTRRALFFPVYNATCDTTPPPIPVGECPSALAAAYPFPPNGTSATVDGRSIQHLTDNCPQVENGQFVQETPSYCVASGPFDVTLPANNLYTAANSSVGAGTYQAVQEGIYLMLAPLTVGAHTLHWTAPGLDITYHLTVTGGGE